MKTITLEPWTSERQEAEAEAGTATQIEEMITSMSVNNQADMDFAAEALRDVKSKIKQLEDMRKQATGPMSDALEAVRSWFRAPIKHYKRCEVILKDKLAAAHTRAAEEEHRQLKVMAEASMAGDAEAAQAALVASQQTQVKAPEGISFREKWGYTVEDFDEIPRQYLMVDHQRVMAEVKANKMDTDIPGIRVTLDTTVAARAK